jgi:hypothetical protein
MRKPISLVLVLGLSSLAAAQEGRPKGPEVTPPRFGVPFKGKVYLQTTPKESLNSVIEAAEKGDFGYLVAHLMDPSFVDARINDRAKQFEPAVEANLAALRDFQQKNLDKVLPEARVPADADKFRERVSINAKAAAFKQLVRDVQDKFTEDPEVLKAMRLFRSGGNFPEAAGDVAKIGHAEIKDRSLFIRKIADRWYVENRQNDEPEAPKEPEKQ